MNGKVKKIAIVCAVLIVASLLTAIILSAVNCKKDDGFDFQAYYNERVEKFVAENEELIGKRVDVAFLGDSLTEYCDVEKYYPAYVTANRGIGGDTTFGLEKRLKVCAYDVNPKVIVLLIGTNNLRTMFDNYENIVKSLKENLPTTDLVILSLLPMGGEFGQKNNQTIIENNVEIKRIANLHECTYIDAYDLLLNPETNEINASYTTEGVHLSDDGYIVLTSAVNAVLQGLLEK